MGSDVTWDVKAGGLAFDADLAKKTTAVPNPPRGVFGEYPGATPKYALNDGVTLDFREQMARLFLQVDNYEAFVNSFTDPASKQIAAVVAGTAKGDGSTSKGGKGYIDFLLQSVQQNLQEKSQIVETLADEHIAYFFGQAAPTFTFGGTLINTKQDDQAMNMLRLYRDMGRGSKLAAKKTLISVRYDGMIVSGAMVNLSWTINAEMEMAVPFSFTLLVKQLLLLPNNAKSGLVQLDKPFATSTDPLSDRYLPFTGGLSTFNTATVKVTAAPPDASILNPAATPVEPAKLNPLLTPAVAETWRRMANTVSPKSESDASLNIPLLQQYLKGTPP